jgi:chromate transporter
LKVTAFEEFFMNPLLLETEIRPDKRLPAPQRPSFAEALRFWFKLGWISFGGTAAHLAIMHDELVEKKRWISNGRFLHALSHCMILPGPEAQQLAIYIGWKLHGKRGGVVAGTLFVLPSMFVLLALSVIYAKFGSLAWIAAIFSGLKPVVIALVIVALQKISRRALRGPVQSVTAVAAFAAMFFFDVSLLVVMFGAVVLGIVLGALRPGLLHHTGETAAGEDEESYYIHRGSIAPEPTPLLKPAAKVAASAFFLWLLPLPFFYIFVADFHFWRDLTLFFTKTAFVTVGGSYTVIPYVAKVAVTKLHWLSRSQMMDGFALAETTPGPLIIVVAFVGFLAAYNHFHGSLWMGALGLVATSFYTFLPCFLFVFAGAPLVERTQDKPMIGCVLQMITAVVVASILDLTLFLGKAAIFPSGVVGLKQLDAVALIWVLLSLFLLQKLKWKTIPLILLGIGFGSIRYFLGL